MKTTAYTASAPAAKPAGETVVLRPFRQEMGQLIRILLFFIAVSGVIVALAMHRYGP